MTPTLPGAFKVIKQNEGRTEALVSLMRTPPHWGGGVMLGVSEKIQKTFKQKHYATFILHVHKCSYNIVTTSNVYSNFFIARRGRKVSATEGCYSHAGWSPQEHTAQRRAELLTRGGGGRAAAGTCRRAHLRGAWGPRLAARLLIYLPGGGGGCTTEEAAPGLSWARAPKSPQTRTSSKKQLFYFNCKLLQCNKTQLVTKSYASVLLT